MASKSERAAIGIISVIHGAVRGLVKGNFFSRVDFKRDLADLNHVCINARHNWTDNYTDDDIKWTLIRLDDWGIFLDRLDTDVSSQVKVLVRICSIASGDLLDKTTDPSNKRYIQRINEDMERFDTFIDPEGRAFSSMEEADHILKFLYKLMGFKL